MKPVSRVELIRRWKSLGFEGPFAGGKHEFLIRNNIRLTLPNPHGTVIGMGLLRHILQQAGISNEEWNNAGQ